LLSFLSSSELHHTEGERIGVNRRTRRIDQSKLHSVLSRAMGVRDTHVRG
jgi:hypothetical protein